jgi:Rps23 Pro-64 3,4-dihydroxylase Tpa1-like proline 4-hydroxylase
MNENNNNFSLIRNSEINRIGPQFIMPIFYDKFKINDIMREQNAFEDEKYIYEHSKIWLRDQNSYKHNHSNILYNPDNEKQYCIIGIDTLINKLEYIHNLYSNFKNDFLVLDNNRSIEEIWEILDKHNFDRMKCYSLKEHNIEQMVNYFKVTYKSNDNYEFITNDEDKNKLINIDEYLNKNVKYKMLMGYQNDYPFPFIVIDNFLKNDKLKEINNCVNKLKIEDSTYKYYDVTWEKNKYAFERNFEPKLENLFKYLNSEDFIFYLEKLTGIKDLIKNDITLKGAGVHKSFNDGFLSMHTDFNMYESEEHGMLDRRINLLLYLNDDWEEEYNGDLLLADMDKNSAIYKVSPILNRCIIFNTSKSSLHGHPIPMEIPEHISRNSIAVYYYTKTENNIDFEGECKRPTAIYHGVMTDNVSDYPEENNHEKKSILKYNTIYNSRQDIINYLTEPTEKYLEIGVEYGITFNNVHFLDKIAVDPDPKFEVDDENVLKKMTSDDFFKQNNDLFDVIFIDGMHQTEYVIKDFNNSICCLKENGKIFVDDILPISYNEQLKVPNKHYYENGILKYGEPWTGDVWKIVYYILKNNMNDIEFTYFNNQYYRGVGFMKIKNKFKINYDDLEEINNYDYYSDFYDYIKILKKLNK